MRLLPKCIEAMLENDKVDEINDFEYNEFIFGENKVKAIVSQAVLDELKKSLRERVKSIEERFSRSQSSKNSNRIHVDRVDNIENVKGNNVKVPEQTITKEGKQLESK